MGEVNVVSFNNEPYSVIFWEVQGVAKHKTVCYSAAEEANALERHYIQGDYYNTAFDGFEIRSTYIGIERKWA